MDVQGKLKRVGMLEKVQSERPFEDFGSCSSDAGHGCACQGCLFPYR
jgi:hypothetical protein